MIYLHVQIYALPLSMGVDMAILRGFETSLEFMEYLAEQNAWVHREPVLPPDTKFVRRCISSKRVICRRNI